MSGAARALGPRPEAIVTDVEGTTTPIAFVHDVLCPYASRELPAFVARRRDEREVDAAVRAAAEEAGVAPEDIEAVVGALLAWIEAERKVTPLRALQGLLREAGYRAGDYRAHRGGRSDENSGSECIFRRKCTPTPNAQRRPDGEEAKKTSSVMSSSISKNECRALART